MAGPPEDAVLRILPQIRATLADHGRMHAEHTKSFKRMELRLSDLQESVVTAIGLAGHANVRHDGVQKQIEELTDRLDVLDHDLRQRVQRLEEKV